MTNMHESVRSAAKEIRDNVEHGYDIYDQIFEVADNLVPVYNTDIIDEWKLIDIYDADDYSGETSIIAQMVAALFEWYQRELTEELSDLL